MTLTLYTFDELTTAQLYAIIAHRLDVFVLGQRAIYRDCDGKDFDTLHLLGTDKTGAIAAYLRILPPGMSFPEASFGRVSVSAAQRGHGLGKELVEYAIGEIRRRYSGPIRIAAQADVEGFYTKLGFVPCSGVYDEQGVPHIEMLLE